MVIANGNNLETILVLDTFINVLVDELNNLKNIDDKNEGIDQISKKIPESEDISIENHDSIA